MIRLMTSKICKTDMFKVFSRNAGKYMEKMEMILIIVCAVATSVN